MAEHRAKQIKDAVAEKLADWLGHEYQVFPHRAYPFADDELPAVTVTYGPGDPLGDEGDGYRTNGFFDEELTLVITAHTKASIASAEDDLMNAHAQIHQAIMDDQTQGLAFVIKTSAGSREAPEIDNDGDAPVMSIAKAWGFEYRHSVTDPTQ